MARQKGTANLAASLEVLAGAPLDARSIVPTAAELLVAANFPYKYLGMNVTVQATGDIYTLIGNDVTDIANWKKQGSGGSGGDSIQVDTMPTPSISNVGDIVEYVGVTDANYKNGLFYMCVSDGQDPATYSWVKKRVEEEETVAIPKAQFDALSQAEKDNGKTYFIPDANILTNFTVMGNRFDKANIYDTSERMVGRWIDGKPLYQKVISNSSTTTMNNSDWTTIPNAPSGADKLVSLSMVNSSLSNILPLAGYIQSGVIKGKNLTTGTAAGDIFVIQYTKTTDASVAIGTENDYSTDEMIIGTWIDGKPIYQKTISQSNSSKSLVNIDLSSSNIETVINLRGIYTRVVNSSRTLFIPFYNYDDGNTKSILRYDTSNSSIQYNIVVPETTNLQIITIQYTKATD